MSTQKAIAFAQQARDAAAYLEMAYRKARRLSQYWYAANMGADVPFTDDPLEDGNLSQPLTNMDIYGVMNRCDELIADMEAGGNTKLNTVVKASTLPDDWRS
jgi:hypothetical protein